MLPIVLNKSRIAIMCWVAYLNPITPHNTLPVWIPIRMSTLNPVASRTNLVKDIQEIVFSFYSQFWLKVKCGKTFNLMTSIDVPTWSACFQWNIRGKCGRTLQCWRFIYFTAFRVMMFTCTHVKCMYDGFKFPCSTLSFTIVSLVAHATPIGGNVNYCKTLSLCFTFGMHWGRSGLPHLAK